MVDGSGGVSTQLITRKYIKKCTVEARGQCGRRGGRVECICGVNLRKLSPPNMYIISAHMATFLLL